jgi:hypothetical protein
MPQIGRETPRALLALYRIGYRYDFAEGRHEA